MVVTINIISILLFCAGVLMITALGNIAINILGFLFLYVAVRLGNKK